MWITGGMCPDVSAPARWFPRGHTCEYHIFFWSSQQSQHLISQSFFQIFQISKSIGWLPAMSDLKKAYIHLNSRIPDDLKFDLNCLLFTHGKICRRCSKKGDSRSSGGTCSSPCPLLAYCNDAQKPNEMLKSLDSVL